MIDREYCVMMARYNAWQNAQLTSLLEPLEPEELLRERGAFFGSILATLNHLLWGDQLWMSRFDGGAGPKTGIPESLRLHATREDWGADRRATDARISRWADALGDDDLGGPLTWYSGAMGAELTRPRAALIVHFFNHQTHHRGQVHAMLTATGSKAPVSDLFFMPDVE